MPAAGEGPGPRMRHQGTSTGWTPASAQRWCPVFTARTVLPVMVIERATLEQGTGTDVDSRVGAMTDPPQAVTSAPMAQSAPLRFHITRLGRNVSGFGSTSNMIPDPDHRPRASRFGGAGMSMASRNCHRDDDVDCPSAAPMPAHRPPSGESLHLRLGRDVNALFCRWSRVRSCR